MPLPTPLHPRTSALCVTYLWKEWAGYHAVRAYSTSPEREYNAVRQGAGLIDVTPLYKYDVTGEDAAAFLSRVMVRDVAELKIGRVAYLCWCDDDGKVIDDGTCARLAPNHYRVTAAAPAYHWLSHNAARFRVTIEDTSAKLAALALQGPMSRHILRHVCDADLDAVKFFGLVETRFDGVHGVLTRTGYTGDLGYELWVQSEQALALWDSLMMHGRDYGLEPFGLDTLDICRIEAGFILHGVDYHGAHQALTEAQKSTPLELGLGWTVTLERGPFIGSRALAAERERGQKWDLVGLDIDWQATEELYDQYGLPPALSMAAWRTPIPVYRKGRQVGRASSGTWSPLLKKNLALATVQADCSAVGTVLDIEMTVEWERRTVPATVVKTPFFDPARKKS
ncbi:MAG: aminomethyltransferase family protein [Proteobacteria bacterium]|nr:aminomethyltransferase family protein [Pseudomonadota bacterium]